MSVSHAPEEMMRPRGRNAVEQCTTPKNARQTVHRQYSLNALLRNAVLRQFAKITSGHLRIIEKNTQFEFGTLVHAGLAAQITIHDPRFYRLVGLGGGIGAAEAYIREYWDADDLMMAMRVLARNAQARSSMEKGVARILRPIRIASHWLRRNTRAGSQRNISAHYDLSNAFFALMLDPTMTYSSGIFLSPDSTLEQASVEKYDRICRKLRLTPADHVLEIGTGWGGFAEHAVRNYGCRLTTTTISDQQYRYAKRRFRQQGLQDRIALLQKDYRDLMGKYDKLVSIEMIEAVGEKFLPTYFAKCSDLLRRDGAMLLQAITIPDHRYDRYRTSVDFIQRYIFPGGFLPSISAIATSVGNQTDFRFTDAQDFGSHYAETLACWRRNFWNHLEEVISLGFDRRFVRTWDYYLRYCEAGFREREIGVSQLLLTKPRYNLEPDHQN